MRALICVSVCLSALIGCASPRPVAPSAAAVAAKETEQQHAQRLIDFSVDSGEPINTSNGKKLVCRKESVTNTRLKDRKICLTTEQWQARSDNAKEGFKDALKGGETLPPKGN